MIRDHKVRDPIVFTMNKGTTEEHTIYTTIESIIIASNGEILCRLPWVNGAISDWDLRVPTKEEFKSFFY